MSASWRLTWAISEIGRNEANANRISSGSVVAIELMLGGKPGADHRDGEPAEPGHDFELRGLRGQVAQQVEADLLVAAHQIHKAAPPAGNRLERDEVGEALDRLGDIGAEQPEGVARLRAEPVDPRPRHDRSETGIEDEGQQCQGDRPGDECQRQQHRRRHQDRDQSRRDGMGEEIFDRLDVLVGERDQVAGAPPHQIGRRQGVELAEQIDPHFRQQPIGDVVRQPGFEPVQEPGERRRQREQDQQIAEGRAGLDRGDRERAEDARPR